MTLWDDLVAAATVGTERRSFDYDRLRPLAGEELPAVAGAEGQVLAAAAIVDNYRRAGRRPDRPACSGTAGQVLAVLLAGMVPVAGGSEAMIEAWLSACARAGQRPPDRLLTALLDLGASSPRLRPAVAAAAGARGEWLGRANPDWSWAAGPSPPADASAGWATATTADRAHLLTSLREGGDRAAALTLLRSTWAAEAAADRAHLLAALGAGLADDDEPFLEEALDDRAASVRAAAAGLLDRLPRSRRAARMADRARALVAAEGRRRRRVTARPPEMLDASARRDGVTDARAAGTGLHAAWLQRIVAATPLDVWEPHLGMPPTEAVAGAAAGSPDVLAGWEQAALAQRDERWARALLDHHPSPALVDVLSPPHARRYAADCLRRAVPPDARFFDALAAPGPWDTALSALAVERARAAPPAALPRIVPLLAWRLDTAVLPGVEAWIEALPAREERARGEVRALAHALSIRATIAQELT